MRGGNVAPCTPSGKGRSSLRGSAASGGKSRRSSERLSTRRAVTRCSRPWRREGGVEQPRGRDDRGSHPTSRPRPRGEGIVQANARGRRADRHRGGVREIGALHGTDHPAVPVPHRRPGCLGLPGRASSSRRRRPLPEPEDLATTVKLIAADRVLGISVLNHVIVARDPRRWHSMASRGTLPRSAWAAARDAAIPEPSRPPAPGRQRP
jgi:hypothetical protein